MVVVVVEVATGSLLNLRSVTNRNSGPKNGPVMDRVTNLLVARV